MRRLIRACTFVLLLASCALAYAEGYWLGRFRLALIDDPVRVEFQSGAPVPTRDALQQAITSAAASQDWKVANPADGRMELTRTVRNEHTMLIEVTYSSSGYLIRYLQSTNLMYSDKGAKGENVRVIHGNYNEWINDLVLAVNRGLGTQTQTTIGFARTDNVDAVPFLKAGGRSGYKEFLATGTPRAFAIAPNGSWGRDTQKTNNTRWDVVENALERCNRRGEGQCRLYAIDNHVVWTVPEKKTP